MKLLDPDVDGRSVDPAALFPRLLPAKPFVRVYAATSDMERIVLSFVGRLVVDLLGVFSAGGVGADDKGLGGGSEGATGGGGGAAAIVSFSTLL